jgi:hypothetical protein
MKALLVILFHFRHGRDLAGRKAHTWGKPFKERVGHDCDGLLSSRTLPLSGRQGGCGNEAESWWWPVHSRGLFER